MRHVMLIVIVIAMLIVVFLSVTKTNRVPKELRQMLTTEQGVEIERVTQLPGAVRKKLDEEQIKAEKRLEEEIKKLEEK